ncbi:hypothetical protein MHLP_03740 [Candidatus Mycoplasma haematolamae str. Purdue]|uniref:Uncharacterized protein n=1 Tax=Mycoplasma haematolamae (strain Purdue) TaxID=1212765 RepID=I7BKB9_MYCHA|nr:hypothetical protein [Candidatus Mycoplasma haematolamae]AFO52328.1 hypothetical protein MHLP_03740 [Candidatus Mycoplasma haematolamae str. Purdue]
MALTSLWLKGLSQQGKIYLATSSLALGAGVTGTLAVDSTRGSIWQGVSYVGSSISGFLGKAVEASGAPPAQVSNSDNDVNEIFKDAWGGLTLVVSSGAKWSWNSITFIGDKLTKIQKTYEAIKGYLLSAWSFLKDNWEALWVFAKHSFTSIDLEKIYKLLSDSSRKSKVMEVLKKDGPGGWKNMMKDLKEIDDKSKTISFDVTKPFQKIMKKLMEKPESMSVTGTRLGFLKGFISGQSSDSAKGMIDSLIDFFSKEDEDISGFQWNWFSSAQGR